MGGRCFTKPERYGNEDNYIFCQHLNLQTSFWKKKKSKKILQTLCGLPELIEIYWRALKRSSFHVVCSWLVGQQRKLWKNTLRWIFLVIARQPCCFFLCEHHLDSILHIYTTTGWYINCKMFTKTNRAHICNKWKIIVCPLPARMHPLWPAARLYGLRIQITINGSRIITDTILTGSKCWWKIAEDEVPATFHITVTEWRYQNFDRNRYEDFFSVSKFCET